MLGINAKKIKFALLSLIICILAACNASTPEKKEIAEEDRQEFVFPPAPEVPRFYYEMTLFHSGQLLQKTGEDKWREFLTGENETLSGEALAKPYDVSACGGRVYITDTVRRHVAVYDFNDRSYFRIGGKEPGTLRKPLGISTDANCRVYVADISVSAIKVYDSTGKYLTAVGGVDWFHRLSHVAVNAEGTRIYAVDTGGVQTEEHRIRVFDAQTGAHLFDIGQRGKDEGQFNLPKDIDVGRDGMVHVVDSGNFRVQMFDADGNFIRTFGSVGNRTGQFARPKGIASDPEGNIYVADTSLANFQIFNAEGQLLMFIGNRTKESQPAGYMLPSGIDVDEDGRIYFVDQFFRKVDIYRPAGIEAESGALGRVLYAQPAN